MKITGIAPLLLTATILTPSAGSVGATGSAPTHGLAIPTITGALTASGVEPTVQSTGDSAITPSVGTLTFTGIEPSLFAQYFHTPTVGALTIAGVEPNVSITAPVEITPPVGAAALAGVEPTIQITSATEITPTVGRLRFGVKKSATPSVGSLLLQGIAPSLFREDHITPTVGAVALAGVAPTFTVREQITPSVGAVEVAGVEPILSRGTRITPSAGSLSTDPPFLVWTWTQTSGEDIIEWRVDYGRTSGNYTENTTIADETLGEILARSVITAGPGTWYATIVAVGASGDGSRSNEVEIDPGIVTLDTGGSPSPAPGAAVLLGFAPTVSIGYRGITPLVGALALTGIAPSTETSTILTPGVGSLSADGVAPSLSLPIAVTPPVGTLTAIGIAPTRSTSTLRTPLAASVASTGQLATATQSEFLTRVIWPSVGSAVIGGVQPSLLLDVRLTPSAGAVGLAGIATDLGRTYTVTPNPGAVTLAGLEASILPPSADITPSTGELWIGDEGSRSIRPSVGSLDFDSQAPGSGRYITPSTGTLTLAPPTIGWTWTPTGGEAVTDWWFEYGRVSGLYTNFSILADETLRQVVARDVITAGSGWWYIRIRAYHDGDPGTYSNELYINVGTPTIQIGAGNTDAATQRNALTLVGIAPTLQIHEERTPSVGSLTTTGIAPSLYISEIVTRLITPTVGSLSLTGVSPSHGLAITPSAGAVTVSGIAASLAPAVTQITPAAGALTLAGTVWGRAEVFCTPSTGTLDAIGAEPPIGRGGPTTWCSGIFPPAIVIPAKLTGGTPMSRSSLREAIQLRLGDPDGVFMPDAYAHTLITEAQEIMAEHGPPIIRRVGVPIKANVTFYRLTEYAADGMAPVRIFCQSRTAPLEPTTQEELDAEHAAWMAATGTPSVWFARGWNQFGVYPKAATDGGILWVDYLAWPQVLLHDAAESEYGPEDRETIIAYGLYDGVLLGAQTEEIKPAWEQFQTLLKRGVERRASLTKDRLFRLQQAGGNGHR